MKMIKKAGLHVENLPFLPLSWGVTEERRPDHLSDAFTRTQCEDLLRSTISLPYIFAHCSFGFKV